MAKRLNVSEARKAFPSLFDRVTTRDGERVAIHRRGAGREAVLVSREYLERLEAGQVALAAREPFTIFGSGRLNVPPDDILKEVRAAERRESEKRMKEFASPPPRRRRG